MTSKFSFSSPLIEKFVFFIKANPVLYNVLDVNYKNFSLKNRIWKDISIKIEKSVDETKQLWENIRDLYSRITARKLETGSSFNKKKLWILTYYLSFLDQDECGLYLNSNITKPEMNNPSTFNKEKGIVELLNKTEDDWPMELIIQNCHISKLNQNDEYVFENSNKPRTLSQKIQIKNEQFSSEEVNQIDDMDLFFENVSLKAKQFPSTGRIEVKMKICAIMNELEEKYLNRELPLRPRPIQPIYLFKNVHISKEQIDYSSSSSIQSCTSTLPSLHSDSEFF